MSEKSWQDIMTKIINTALNISIILALLCFSAKVLEGLYEGYEVRKMLDYQSKNCEPMG